MTRLLLFFILATNFLFGQENKIDKSISDKFLTRDLSTIQTLKDLSENISELTVNKKEQLQMLLLWSYQNMYADSIRFFQSGNPLTTAESIKKRIALCDEFSNIFSDFCKAINIPCIRIEGYVKYLNFKPNENFAECNHAWNAVYIDSTWLLCDIFWSTNVLKTDSLSTPHFIKKLNTKYFLATPKIFIVNHLPCDPIFQFDNYPIKINAFTVFSDSIDLRMEKLPFLDYNDSIKILMKLKSNDRSLRIAQHSYFYNKFNPNFLISEYYNYGVSIVNNKTSTKTELKKAKYYFTSALALIDQSDVQDIKALKENCKQGVNNINRKLNAP
jgi:transglutaminase/protease-like cytokinesis protein 3